MGDGVDPDRVVLRLEGADVLPFLQGLVSNDVLPLANGPGLVWAALLTPQGKYLADFFVGHLPGGELILDLPAAQTEGVQRRLAMYRLRADVRMAPADLTVARGLGAPPEGALADPRHPALGWRLYAPGAVEPAGTDWDALRVDLVVPEAGVELIPDDSYILEHGFERLHGVDFRKGCYVGQEVTARMKHKTELRKGLVRVRVEGETAPGAEITAAGRPAGRIFTRSGDRALAHLRLDRDLDDLRCGMARLWLDPEAPAAG